jgi:hypothetical protein
MRDDFDLEIFHRDGSYLILAHAFGVAVRSEDLQAGMAEALARIDEVGDWYRKAGVEPPSVGPSRHAARERNADRSRTRSRLMEYVPPALVSGAVLSGLILLSSVPLFSAVARLNRTFEYITSGASAAKIQNFGHNAIDMVIRAGDAMDKVTPERKQELRLAVRKIMKGLAPVIEEVGDSGEHEPPTTPPAR